MARILGLIFLTFFFIWTPAQGAKSPFRVVLDPGHGGMDEGTVYSDSKGKVAEKDVALLLARKAAQVLRSHGFEVFLTRDSDVNIPRSERTALANRLKADAFISIHMNASGSSTDRDTFGIETYFLNSTTDESSKRLARYENFVLGGNSDPQWGEGSDIALILKDLRLDANLTESKRLACHVQHQLIHFTSKDPSEVVSVSPRNRGIKQALFYVLLGADMPAILVEAGFLSQAQDRALVLSEKGQLQIGSALSYALEQFRTLKGTRQAQQVVSNCKVR